MASKTTKTIFALALIAIVAVLVWINSRSDSVEVTVTEAMPGEVESTVTNTRAGSVTACRRAKLAPLIGGQISKLHVTEGQKVSEGDVLVELWNQDQKAQLELAKTKTTANVAKAKEACIRLDVADNEAKRQQRLLKQGLTSQENAESAQGTADAARSACDAAKGLAAVAASRVKVVEAELERTTIRAPFNGIVAEVNGETGEIVTPSPVGVPTLPVVDLIDYECIYVSAPIDEIDAPRIKIGMPARIVLDAFPDHPFDAEVKKISPYVQDFEKQARTVLVDVYFSRVIGEHNLLPGYSADAEIILDKKENVVRIPTESIFDEEYVYIYQQDSATVKKQKISKGIGNWRFTEVTEGVNVGDKIVTSIGIEGLSDGASVKINQESG